MSDDILSEYGNDSGAPQKPRATSGGAQTNHKDLPYSPPVGPKNHMHQGPGLGGGTNYGCYGTQGKH